MNGRSTTRVAPLLCWLRFATVITARAALAVVFGLTFWAVAPLTIGWQTTTVMTGSMEPAITPGDLVVSRPVDPADLRPGRVLLVDDPDHQGRLRLHRLHAVDGLDLVTKGDANPEIDSSPVERSDVIGLGVLRVPWIGSPIRDAREGDALSLVVALIALAATICAALAPAVRGADNAPPGQRPRTRGTTDTKDDLPVAAKRRVASSAMAIVAVLTIAATGTAAPAHAASFAAATQTPGALRAATAQAPSELTCGNNLDGTVTIRWTYAAEEPSSFDVLIDGHGSVANLGPSARSITLRANSPFSFGSTSVVRVRTNLTPTWGATSTTAVNVTTRTIFRLGIARCG